MKRQIYNMIHNNDFANPKEFEDFVNANISNYQFIFYDNDGDDKQLRIVKAKPIPKDFKYVVKEPEKQSRKKAQFTTEIGLWSGAYKK